MFSVLMPIFNGIEYIDESVQSVINQTFTEWELLILINGHEENSDVYKRAKEFETDSRIKVYDLVGIKGKSNALNYGVDFCIYDKVALIDVDDKWATDKLLKQSRYVNDYDVVGTLCKYFGDSEKHPNIPIGEIERVYFIEVNPIINSSACFNKKDAYWDSYYDGVEDYDMWLRLNKEGKTFYNYPEVLTFHRIHSNSCFNSTDRQEQLRQQLINKYF